MKFFIPLFLCLAGTALASPPDCSRNNCNRAVGGTRIPGHLATASADCSRILASTVYKATVTIYSNVTKTVGKRAISSAVTVPTYAIAGCDDLAEYSSACSCLGVTGSGITIGSTTVTIIQTATITGSGTGTGTGTVSGTGKGTATGTGGTPTPTPCSSNLKTDPLNCGKCGNVCPSGVCSNGVCSSEVCNAQTCGGFTNCNPSNTECFCFSSVETTVEKETGEPANIGFCGQNAMCSDLTPCKKSSDCNIKGSTGNVCAVNTCCGETGICLVGSCGNPARKLIRMALAGSARIRGTAAY